MDKRVFGGLLVMIFGLVLVVVSFFVEYWILIYGIPLTIIGAIIMINRNEDKIEKINYKGGKK